MTISLLGRHYEGIQLRPLTDIRQNDIAEWQALAREALEPNPFFEPEFVLPLAAAFPEDNARLLVVKGNSRWEACLPVVVRQPWRRLPIPVMTTWLTKYSFLGTPLVAAGGRDTL